MTADHLLHVAPEAGWHGLTLSCLPTGEHYPACPEVRQ